MIAVLNPHIVSRLGRHHRENDVPMRLTAAEQEVFDSNVEHCADALVRFENIERYTAQSAATRIGDLAPLPPRPSLRLVSASPAAPATPPPPARGAAGLAPLSTDKDMP